MFLKGVGTRFNEKSNVMPRSCAEARSSNPTLKSGDYYVDPDGTNIGDDPISVFCDMATGFLYKLLKKSSIKFIILTYRKCISNKYV